MSGRRSSGAGPLFMRFPHFFKTHAKVFCSFTAMQAMQLLLPLLALPWLARVLGPDAFGSLMYLCLIPPLVALFVDWGLGIGASRAAAGLRGQRGPLACLLGAVLSAKIILCGICIAICLLLQPLLPYAARYPGAYALAVCAGIARGLSPVWFFQGAGCGMVRMGTLDVAASVSALLLTLLCIHKAATWPLYLLFIAACKGCAYGWLIFRLCRKLRPRISFAAGIEMLQQTAAFFGSAFALMVCYNGGQMVLGLFLPPAQMGIMAAAMKMLRALASLILPFTQTLFPELCIMRQCAPARARKLLRASLLLTLLGAILASFAAWLLAPWLIHIALGRNYGLAVPVLRSLLLAAPLMACNNVLAFQILAPFGQEKAQLKTQVACALANLPLAAILGSCQGIAGAAFWPLCCEMLMLAAFAAAIRRCCPTALWSPDAGRQRGGA